MAVAAKFYYISQLVKIFDRYIVIHQLGLGGRTFTLNSNISNCHLRRTQKINVKNNGKFFQKIGRSGTYNCKRRVEGSLWKCRGRDWTQREERKDRITRAKAKIGAWSAQNSDRNRRSKQIKERSAKFRAKNKWPWAWSPTWSYWAGHRRRRQ